MHVLVRGLPREALVRTPADRRGADPWTSYHELLAQIVEVTSIPAANHALKKPVKIKRPGDKAKTAQTPQVRTAAQQPGPNPYRRAMAALGAAPPPRLRVVRPGDDEEDRTP